MGGSDIVTPLAKARRAVAAHEWQEAVVEFSAADDGGDALGEDDLASYATAAYLLGRVDSAVEILGRSYESALDDGDLGGAVTSGFWVIFMLLSTGSEAQAGGWIGRCTALLDEIPEDAVQHAYIPLLEGLRAVAVEHDYDSGGRAADAVVARARTHGDANLLALGLMVGGRALVRSGRVVEGMRRLDEAMVELVSGSLSPIVAGTVYCSMIEACEEIAAVQRAQEWTEALTRWCERQEGMVTFNGQCLTHRASIMRRHGEWDEAAAEADRARRRFAGAADEAATGRAVYERAELHRLRGEVGDADARYAEAARWGHDPQPGLALLRLQQGKVDAAAATMRRRLGEAAHAFDRIRLLPAYVEVMLAAGDVEAAGDAADELAVLADRYGTAALAAHAAHASGAVALARGEPDTALAALRRACAGWRSLQSPYEEASTRLLVAEACRALGDDETAALERAAAADVLDRLGAVPPSIGRSEPDHDLSPRELEVLGLVVTGMTNQQIADELFLAVKTIERHVGNILTKLDVPSRTAATAYAYEHGLV